MATITLKGNPIQTNGELPPIGQNAPDFTLVNKDLSEVSLASFKGKKVVLNIFPSVDTPTCAASVRHFNKDAANYPNTVVLCISADLPFAQKRFCAAEGLENVQTLSTFRALDFAKKYGVAFVNGPLVGLNARAVVVLDENGKVIYTELVGEVANEANYEKALAVLK